MVITDLNGGYIFSRNYSNIDFTTDKSVIQIIDDNSELGQKIISMIPCVKLIYTNGVVTDCEDTTPEPEDIETDIMSMTVDHEYRLTLLELGVETEV